MRHDRHRLAISGARSPGEHVPHLVHGHVVESGPSKQLDISRGACRLLERRCRDLGQHDELPFNPGLELAHDRERATDLGPRDDDANLGIGLEVGLS